MQTPDILGSWFATNAFSDSWRPFSVSSVCLTCALWYSRTCDGVMFGRTVQFLLILVKWVRDLSRMSCLCGCRVNRDTVKGEAVWLCNDLGSTALQHTSPRPWCGVMMGHQSHLQDGFVPCGAMLRPVTLSACSGSCLDEHSALERTGTRHLKDLEQACVALASCCTQASCTVLQQVLSLAEVSDWRHPCCCCCCAYGVVPTVCRDVITFCKTS